MSPVYEVRSLNELAERLVDRPNSLGLIEVRSANLAEVLAWLTEVGPATPTARFAALADCAEPNRGFQSDVTDALRTAGAVEIVDSPRHLHRLLPLGHRHVAEVARRPDRFPGEQSFADWAWASLPW